MHFAVKLLTPQTSRSSPICVDIKRAHAVTTGFIYSEYCRVHYKNLLKVIYKTVIQQSGATSLGSNINSVANGAKEDQILLELKCPKLSMKMSVFNVIIVHQQQKYQKTVVEIPKNSSNNTMSSISTKQIYVIQVLLHPQANNQTWKTDYSSNSSNKHLQLPMLHGM